MDYVIRLNGKTTPLPWSNILAEEGFGAIVTESGGGYTWSDNSAEHKLTPLANDPVADAGGELLLAREERGACWSLLPAPCPRGNTWFGMGSVSPGFPAGRRSSTRSAPSLCKTA